MALIDREYMRRDQPTGSTSRTHKPNPDVERLLKNVKPARLVPAHRVPIALTIGLMIGAAVGYWLPPLI